MIQQQAILINDLSGFGRCSLSVWMPILCAAGMECLMLPCALLSNHTAYPDSYARDLSEDIDPWLKQWQTLPIHPSLIMSGYIASAKQGTKVRQAIEQLRKTDTLVICDPAMADEGVLYSGLDSETVSIMKQIAAQADLIVPNLTEACLLSDTPVSLTFNEAQIEELGEKLLSLGPAKAVITGIGRNDQILEAVFERGCTPVWIRSPRKQQSRAGTGDVFSAVLGAMLIQGRSLQESVQTAGAFVRSSMELAEQMQTDPREGVPFECLLGEIAIQAGCMKERGTE